MTSPIPSRQARSRSPAAASGAIPARDGQRRIALHRSTLGPAEAAAAAAAVESGILEGGGPSLARVEKALRDRTGSPHALGTTSCTHALELLLMAHGVGPGDEVIVPAYTFPATATCVVRQGAQVVFADSRKDDPNLDPADVARRATPRTRAVILMHYGGVPCDVAGVREAVGQGVLILEDAAHALDSRLDGRACGTLGDGGCFSFHATKNLTCGEGGALLLQDDAVAERAAIGREMGTDRAALRAGRIDRYTWRDGGSSFLPSDVLMAILAVQLEKADAITQHRRRRFSGYMERLEGLARAERVRLPAVPPGAEVNGHIFHVLLRDQDERQRVRAALDAAGIDSSPHYDALDATPFGRTLVPSGTPTSRNAAAIAARLLRLPIHTEVSESDEDRIVAAVAAAVR